MKISQVGRLRKVVKMLDTNHSNFSEHEGLLALMRNQVSPYKYHIDETSIC